MNYRMHALNALTAALFVVNGTAFAVEGVEDATHEGKLVSIPATSW